MIGFIKKLFCCGSKENKDIEMFIFNKRDIEYAIINILHKNKIFSSNIIIETNKLPCTLKEITNKLEYEIYQKHYISVEIIIKNHSIRFIFDENPFSETCVFYNNY